MRVPGGCPGVSCATTDGIAPVALREGLGFLALRLCSFGDRWPAGLLSMSDKEKYMNGALLGARELAEQFPGPRLPDEMMKEVPKATDVPFWMAMNVNKKLKAISSEVLSGVDLVDKYGVEDARARILTAYYNQERPVRKQGFDWWIARFESVGLRGDELRDGKKRVFFRGADKRHPHGLSWTPFFEIALGFALSAARPAVFYVQATPYECIHARMSEVDPRVPLEVILDSRGREIGAVPNIESWVSLVRDASV